MHSTSSNRQFVQGAPCSVTLQRTFRVRQHWHAFEALLFTGLVGCVPSNPATEAFLFVGLSRELFVMRGSGGLSISQDARIHELGAESMLL